MVQNFLRKYIWLLIIILSIGYIFFSQKNPCNSPITYKIGTFDTQFGITQKEFLQVIAEASKTWGDAVGKPVLVYSQQGDLTINLIYDERQKITQTNAALKADANKIKNLANSVKIEYLALENDRQVKEKEYEDLVVLFKQQETDYSTQVSYWNARGGASKDVYAQLIVQRDGITQQLGVIESKRLELNALVSNINTFINKYNLLVSTANTNIDTINLTAGKEFKEGIYDPLKNAITIYEFSAPKKLARVITHELGHALLLPHNNNPVSIMYPINQANTLSLSKEDKAALVLRCTTTFPFINFYNNLKERFLSFLP